MGIAKLSKRTAIIGSAIAVAAVGGGIAFAAWTSTGSGSGGATAGTASDVTISAGTSPSGLYPGGPAGNVVVSVSNPNAYPIDLTGITGVVTVDPAHAVSHAVPHGVTGACDATMVSFVATSTPIHVTGGGTSSSPIVLDNQTAGTIALTPGAVDGCQGATFTVALTGTATSG